MSGHRRASICTVVGVIAGLLLVEPSLGVEGGRSVIFADDFESGNSQGWLIGKADPGDQGDWVIGDPVGVMHNELQAQPEDAYRGTGCAYTSPNTTPTAGDVDGEVYMQTPPLNLSGETSVTLSYVRWYYQQSADPTRRYFRVRAKVPESTSWVLIEQLTATQNSWNQVSVRLEDYIPLVDGVLVRFTAFDRSTQPGVVEAALDDVVISAGCQNDAQCAPDGFCSPADGCLAYGVGDFDGDSDVDLLDFASFQGCYGFDAGSTCAPGNLTGTALIDEADYALFAAALENLLGQ